MPIRWSSKLNQPLATSSSSSLELMLSLFYRTVSINLEALPDWPKCDWGIDKIPGLLGVLFWQYWHAETQLHNINSQLTDSGWLAGWLTDWLVHNERTGNVSSSLFLPEVLNLWNSRLTRFINQFVFTFRIGMCVHTTKNWRGGDSTHKTRLGRNT